MLRTVTGILAVLIGAGACSQTGSTSTTPLNPATICEAQADRWQRVQQSLLDEIGTAGADEMVTPSSEVSRAFNVAAASLIELERDARQVGCADDVASGSALLCDRANRLRAEGSAGRMLIEDLRSKC